MDVLETIQKTYDKKIVIEKDFNYEIRVSIQNILHKNIVDINIYVYFCNNKKLNLLTEYYGKESRIKIVDIQVEKDDRNQGYGSVAMNILFEIGELLGVTKYTGFLSDNDIYDIEDLEHKDRLVRFYTKFDFVVDIDNRRIEKTYIIKK